LFFLALAILFPAPLADFLEALAEFFCQRTMMFGVLYKSRLRGG
jgi:hypothetical protein